VEVEVEPWRSEERRGLFVGKKERRDGINGREREKNLVACVLALAHVLAFCSGVVFI
jgi:hypothetical protein